MTEDQMLRMQCLDLAQKAHGPSGYDSAAITKHAQAFYDFATGSGSQAEDKKAD